MFRLCAANLSQMKIALAVAILFAAGLIPAVAQSDKKPAEAPAAKPKTLAEAKIQFNVREKAVAIAPLQKRLPEIEKEYIDAVHAALAAAKKFEKPDDAAILEVEVARIKKGNPENPVRAVPATLGLRTLRNIKKRLIYFENQKKASRQKMLRNDFIATLTELEDGFLRKQDTASAERIDAFRQEVLKDWKATRTTEPHPEVDTSAIAIQQTNDIKLLPQFVGKSGRLRVIGEFHWKEPVLPLEVERITDFVEVHAFSQGWLALRKNGEAVIYTRPGKNPPLQLIHTQNFQQVSRSLDFWTIRGKQPTLWREFEGRKWPLPAENPVGIATCHTLGVLYYADGTVIPFGSGHSSSRLGAPPGDFFTGTSGTVGSNLWIMALTPEGTVRSWDAVKRKRIEFPQLRNVVEIDCGRYYGLVRKADDTLETVYLDGKPGVDARWKIPSEAQGIAKKIRCGEIMSALQREDGTWMSWGPNKRLNAEIAKIGAAMDLDLYANALHGYALYIEPVDK